MKIDLKDLEAKSDQMNAVDFVKPMVFRVVKIDYTPRDKQCISMHLEGCDGRPYKPCLSMRRGLVKVWGDELDLWAGKLIQLYCEPSVKWGGEATGGIRISAVSGISEPFDLVVQLNKKQREIQTWDVLPDEQPVVKEFILTHHVSNINEAMSNEAIDKIVMDIKHNFGVDVLTQLKDTVISARAKLKDTLPEKPTQEQEKI